MSPIQSKYTEFQALLGQPLHEERSCPDGVGRYCTYEHGSIHWHPDSGAHETHGTIRAQWAALGWEGSFLKYPTTDEQAISAYDLEHMGFTFNTFTAAEIGRTADPLSHDPSYARISHFTGGAIVYEMSRDRVMVLQEVHFEGRFAPRYMRCEPRSSFFKRLFGRKA